MAHYYKPKERARRTCRFDKEHIEYPAKGVVTDVSSPNTGNRTAKAESGNRSRPRYLIYRFSHGDIHCFLGLVVVVYGKSNNASKKDSVNDADKLR